MIVTDVDGRRVEYELAGTGDPVVFVHARPFVGWYRPLVERLGDRTTLVARRAPDHHEPLRIEDEAAWVAALLDRLGVERPHVVGHSYGGVVALEIARQGRVDVRSLALLEPATTGLVDPDEAEARTAPLIELARHQGPAAAMETFLLGVCGRSGRAVLDELLPGSSAEAFADAAAFFETELPALVRWRFDAADAAAIDVPVIVVSGSDSEPRFTESTDIVRAWFPASSAAVVPASHLLMVQAPRETAEHLTSFWRRA